MNSQFYPTMPIGFIVLAGNCLQIGKPYLPASTIFAVANIFWVIGSLIILPLIGGQVIQGWPSSWQGPILIFNFICWAFGIWWFVMSVIMTFHYIGRKALPFAMSWWAFVFPLGAYVGSSYMLYTVYGLSSLNWIGFGLYWLLLFLWVITAWKTIAHLIKGDLFVPSQG